MSHPAESLEALLRIQRMLPRGPDREAALALWLTVRVALDLGMAVDGEGERGSRSRVALLQQRISRMALPQVMQRGLATALQHLAELTPTGARIGLTQLVAPTRDRLGSEAAEAISRAARLIHEEQRAGMDHNFRAWSPRRPAS